MYQGGTQELLRSLATRLPPFQVLCSELPSLAYIVQQMDGKEHILHNWKSEKGLGMTLSVSPMQGVYTVSDGGMEGVWAWPGTKQMLVTIRPHKDTIYYKLERGGII